MIILKYNWNKYLIDFGTELGFNIWDWSAVVISICSFIVAACSLRVAMMTLKSQKNTEKNTLPLMNKNIQIFLLNNTLRELYESFISMNALYSILEFTHYKVYPSKQFWDLVYIDETNFHLDLVYDDETKFRKLYYLKAYIDKFNSDVSDLHNYINQSDTSKDFKKEAILRICNDIMDLLQLWLQVYIVSFDLTKYKALTLLEQNFLYCDQCKFNTIFNDDKDIIRHYIKNSPFENNIDEIINNIDNKINNLVILYSLDYRRSAFKSNVWHYVDLVLLNVLYANTSFAGYVVDNLKKRDASTLSFSESDEYKSNFVQNNYMNHSWLFYLVDL